MVTVAGRQPASGGETSAKAGGRGLSWPAKPAGREAGCILIPRPRCDPKLPLSVEGAVEATLLLAQRSDVGQRRTPGTPTQSGSVWVLTLPRAAPSVPITTLQTPYQSPPCGTAPLRPSHRLRSGALRARALPVPVPEQGPEPPGFCRRCRRRRLFRSRSRARAQRRLTPPGWLVMSEPGRGGEGRGRGGEGAGPRGWGSGRLLGWGLNWPERGSGDAFSSPPKLRTIFRHTFLPI